MIKILKNMYVSLCGLALSTSLCGGVYAQVPIRIDSVFDELPTPSATPVPEVDKLNFRLSLVTEAGSFKNVFKSFNEAYDASEGNSYNQTLKKESEIVVMNARCGDDFIAGKYTFSLYRINSRTQKDLEPTIKSYLDYRQSNPSALNTREGKRRERALIDDVMRILAVRFPRKAQCDAVPTALSLPFGALRLEVDDAQNPWVGPKFNDGFLYHALSQNEGLMASAMAKKREFWLKNGYNDFPTAQDALNTAGLLAGTKILMFNGNHFSLYRFGDFESDYKADDTKYDVFKTTHLPKGWKIVALVVGRKLVVIHDPNAR